MLYISIFFGTLLPVLYGSFKYWKRSHVKVNCWFCGLNNIILKKCQDGWICKHCEQYNGFKSDGDYNRDIPSQWDSSLNGRLSFCSKPQTYTKPSNGLCEDCNRNQEMKVAQLASFQPINPENFDQEIENFSYHLERAYRLCPPCESVLEDTLSRKKTHILDINLQMSGKNSAKIISASKISLQKSLVWICAFVTVALASTIAASTLVNLSSDHIIFKVLKLTWTDNVPKTQPKSSSLSPISYFLPQGTVCLSEAVDPNCAKNPFSSLLNATLRNYLNLAEAHRLLLIVVGFSLQSVLVWLTGFRISTYLWVTFAATVSIQEVVINSQYIQISQILQLTITCLLFFLSWPQAGERTKSPTKSRTNNQQSRNFGRISPKPHLNKSQFQPQAATQSSITPTLLTNQRNNQDISHSGALKYLTLPARPASVASSHRTLTSASMADNSYSLHPVDVQITSPQEDNRSDASVDSAFSNSDSATLDAADTLNVSQSYLPGKKFSQEGDVQSLIETLSIGSASSRRTNTSQLKSRPFVQEKKRSSIICPSKLNNIMNESVRSGIWRNTSTTLPFTRSSESSGGLNQSGLNQNNLNQSSLNQSVFNQSISRPASPTGSIHSQSTTHCIEPVRSFSPPASFHPVATPWNAPASPQLSVGLPPNPVALNHGFGSPLSPLPNSPMSQVIYTPYGLYHQMMSPYGSPHQYMMPPQSPTLRGSSPNSSYGTQFSPQSFSTSSRICDSDIDGEFSPKSTKKRNEIKVVLSATFLESVWQSRFAIMYTTVCYILLGSAVYALSHSGMAANVMAKIFSWKHSVLSAVI